MNTRALELIIGLVCVAGTPLAHAGDFDGRYTLGYERIQTRAQACIDVEQAAWCGEIDLELVLQDGLIAESSFQLWADAAVAAFEKSTGREVDPRVEAAMEEAISYVWPALEGELNTILSTLPTRMDFDQLDRMPESVWVELYQEGEEGVPTMGSFDEATGAFSLPGFYSGTINASDDYCGVGSATLPFALEADGAHGTATVKGEVRAWFGLDLSQEEAVQAQAVRLNRR